MHCDWIAWKCIDVHAVYERVLIMCFRICTTMLEVKFTWFRSVDLVGKSWHRRVFCMSPVFVVHISLAHLFIEFCWGRVRLEEVVCGPFNSYMCKWPTRCTLFFFINLFQLKYSLRVSNQCCSSSGDYFCTRSMTVFYHASMGCLAANTVWLELWEKVCISSVILTCMYHDARFGEYVSYIC